MQKTKGNLAFAEKYKLVQWLEQNLAKLGGRTYESIAQEATQALGYYISESVLEGINRDEELAAVKWKTSRTAPDEQPSAEQLMEMIEGLRKEVGALRREVVYLRIRLYPASPFNPPPHLPPLNPPRIFKDSPYTEPYSLASAVMSVEDSVK